MDNLFGVGDLTLDPNNRLVTRGTKTAKLSPHEFNLLSYLLENAGKIIPRERLLQKIWKYQPDIESRVVDVYMGYLRKKIDTASSKKIIKTVRGKGYMLEF